MRANWPTPNLWGVGVSFHKSNGLMDWFPVKSIVAPKTHRSWFWFPIEFTMFSIFFWGVAILGKPGKLSNSTDAKRQDVVQVVPIKGVSTASSQHWSQMAQTLVVSNWVSLGKSAGHPWFFLRNQRRFRTPIFRSKNPRSIQRFLEKHPGPAWHPSTCPGAIPIGNMLIDHWIWGYNRVHVFQPNSLPSGNLTYSMLLKMAIYSWFTHWKWWFSIAMLVYQRVRYQGSGNVQSFNSPLSCVVNRTLMLCGHSIQDVISKTFTFHSCLAKKLARPWHLFLTNGTGRTWWIF